MRKRVCFEGEMAMMRRHCVHHIALVDAEGLRCNPWVRSLRGRRLSPLFLQPLLKPPEPLGVSPRPSPPKSWSTPTSKWSGVSINDRKTITGHSSPMCQHSLHYTQPGNTEVYNPLKNIRKTSGMGFACIGFQLVQPFWVAVARVRQKQRKL